MTSFIPEDFKILVKDKRAANETRYSLEFPIKCYKGLHGLFVLILMFVLRLKHKSYAFTGPLLTIESSRKTTIVLYGLHSHRP